MNSSDMFELPINDDLRSATGHVWAGHQLQGKKERSRSLTGKRLKKHEKQFNVYKKGRTKSLVTISIIATFSSKSTFSGQHTVFGTGFELGS